MRGEITKYCFYKTVSIYTTRTNKVILTERQRKTERIVMDRAERRQRDRVERGKTEIII